MNEKQLAYLAKRAFDESPEGKAQAAAKQAERDAAKAAEMAQTREWGYRRMDRKLVAAATVAQTVAAQSAPSHMYRASAGGGWYDSCAAADDEENGRPAGYSARHSF